MTKYFIGKQIERNEFFLWNKDDSPCYFNQKVEDFDTPINSATTHWFNRQTNGKRISLQSKIYEGNLTNFNSLENAMEFAEKNKRGNLVTVFAVENGKIRSAWSKAV